MNAAMAAYGAELVQHGENILTHCNTGSLATPGVGTALGVIREAHRQKKNIHVYVDETRPLLQGGRLTAYELKVGAIAHTHIKLFLCRAHFLLVISEKAFRTRSSATTWPRL